jgi:hypothetical protein
VRETSRRNPWSYDTKKQREKLRENTPVVITDRSRERDFEKELLVL